MNPIMLEHLSRVENDRRSREIRHIQLANQAGRESRHTSQAVAGWAAKIGPVLTKIATGVRLRLVARREGTLPVAEDS
jgi:hypothetical protein